MSPSSSPSYDSQPGEIARLEREAERRQLVELNTQLAELKKVNKIWKKECETLKEKVNDKKRQGTLAKNEAFELTKTLTAISTRLGFDSTPSFLEYLRTSLEPPPLKETSSRIASLESQLADSTSSQAALQTKLDEETVLKEALASSAEAHKVVVEGLQKKLEREKQQADGLAFLLREKDDWRERETKMEEEAVALKQELALAKADAAGLRKELEVKGKGVASSSKPQDDATTLGSPSRLRLPPSKQDSPAEPSKHAEIARLEVLLESSRAEYSLLYAKSKKQKAVWKDYAENYPVAFDTVRAKEEKRAKKRESRGESSKRDGSEVAERSPKRIKIDSPVRKEGLSKDAVMVEVGEVGEESPRRKDPSSSASVGRVVKQPLSNPASSNKPSPASSPARNRSYYRSSSVANQPRSSSLVPTVVDSSPTGRSDAPPSSPQRQVASASNSRESSPLNPIQPSNLPRAPEDPTTRKKERRPHPLGQQAFGPSDVVQPSSSATSVTSTVQPNPIIADSTTIRASHQQLQSTAGPSRTHAFDSPSSHQPSPRPAVASSENATPARPFVRQQALDRGTYTTPINPTVAERDRIAAARTWLGKKTVVNGKAQTEDPLDMEVPMGEPYQVYRYTPKSIARPPKTVRSEPRDAGSSSREASNDAQQRVRSDGDAPLPPPPPAVKIEPDLFTVDIPNPRIPRVLYDSQDERNARYEDPYYRSPESEERDEERRRAVKDPTAGMTPEQKSIFLKKQRNVPASETRKLYAAFKGRGRYNPDIEVGAPGSSKKKTTINDEFQINKSKNDGRDYAFNSVVRGREQRKQLHARDCECCRGYYEAVGPLAPLPQGPRWKSAPPESDEDDDDDVDENGAGPSRPRRRRETREERGKRKRDEEIQKHRQEVSRHRDEWAGPPTPPFYWDIGFPDTQKVALINEAAERIEEDKRARIEAEARKADGRYQRRV